MYVKVTLDESLEQDRNSGNLNIHSPLKSQKVRNPNNPQVRRFLHEGKKIISFEKSQQSTRNPRYMFHFCMYLEIASFPFSHVW